MRSSSCPTPAELSQFERGLLDEPEAQRIRLHLVSCEVCGGSWPASRFAAATEPSSADGLRAAATASGSRHLPQIDGYRITGVLGHGGMGIVYRAVQTKLNRAVALKVLPAIISSASPSAVARFRREATAAARLHHTNIVPVYDFGACGDAYYYAMELINGQPLDVVLRRFAKANVATAPPTRLAEVIRESTTAAPTEPVSRDIQPMFDEPSAVDVTPTIVGRGHPYYQQVARWFAELAEALHAAHSEGIIHRDIKPANLILSTEGRVLIADFGLAKNVEEESVTMTGSLMGTVRYLSPEQAMAKRVAVDHRTDIYSLGATMYESLCFQPAFPGDDHKEILASIIARDPVRPRKVLPVVPPELETICLKTLEKLPDARYLTARALADDLRRYIHDLPLEAKRPSWVARTRKFVRRHRPAVIAAVALLLLIASVPVGIQLRMSKEAAMRREEVARRGEEAAKREQEAATRRKEAAEQVALAQVYEKNERWDNAAAAYQKALATDPDNVPALGNFARMRKVQYNRSVEKDPSLLEDGLAHINKAISIKPDDAEAWNTQGVLLKKLKRYAEAKGAYQEALKLNPDFWAPMENLGIANALTGDLKAAENNLGGAAQLAGRTADQCESPWRNLSAIQLNLGRHEASYSIEQALACNKADSITYRLRARLLLDLPEYRDVKMALQDAERAELLATAPDPLLKRVHAQALLQNRNHADAIKYARMALDADDPLPTADHLIIAIAQAELGRADLAGNAYREALDSWPPELESPGAYTVTAEAGILWFESADELLRLRDEAEAVLDGDPGRS